MDTELLLFLFAIVVDAVVVVAVVVVAVVFVVLPAPSAILNSERMSGLLFCGFGTQLFCAARSFAPRTRLRQVEPCIPFREYLWVLGVGLLVIGQRRAVDVVVEKPATQTWLCVEPPT